MCAATLGSATPCGRARDEDGTLLRHLLGLLLAHRAAQQVGAAERVAREHLRDLHDLLLVQDHAVGREQDGLQIRVQVVDAAANAAVLAVDEVVDHARLQRTRPEQRDQRDDVLERVRLQALDQVFHAARFELEHGRRLAALQQRVRRLRRSSAAWTFPAAGSPDVSRARR